MITSVDLTAIPGKVSRDLAKGFMLSCNLFFPMPNLSVSSLNPNFEPYQSVDDLSFFSVAVHVVGVCYSFSWSGQ